MNSDDTIRLTMTIEGHCIKNDNNFSFLKHKTLSTDIDFQFNEDDFHNFCLQMNEEMNQYIINLKEDYYLKHNHLLKESQTIGDKNMRALAAGEWARWNQNSNEKKAEWFDIREEQPLIDQRVLIWTNNRYYFGHLKCYDVLSIDNFDFDGVYLGSIFWMPLPIFCPPPLKPEHDIGV